MSKSKEEVLFDWKEGGRTVDARRKDFKDISSQNRSQTDRSEMNFIDPKRMSLTS